MVVLHVYGKICPLCISQKLGLFISNLPTEDDNNWKEDLKQELQYMETVDELERARLGISIKSQITELYEKIYPGSEKPTSITAMAHAIADNYAMRIELISVAIQALQNGLLVHLQQRTAEACCPTCN